MCWLEWELFMDVRYGCVEVALFSSLILATFAATRSTVGQLLQQTIDDKNVTAALNPTQ
jgi:hypothetical protein